MHPLIEYAFVVVGLLVGFQSGGYLGYFLVSFSLVAGVRQYMQGGQCRSTRRLEGKTAVITGANTGIGRVTAADLARRGAKVIILCRDLAKAESAAVQIRNESKGEVEVEKMDLTSLTSISDCVKRLKKTVTKIDILINNAGVMVCPLSRTEDGFEMQIGTNHFGHFYLTHLLLPLIKKASPGARIVNVSSVAHASSSSEIHWDDINWEKTEYHPLKAYQQSKLANVLFTKELARRLKESGDKVNVYCLHPGVINTDLWRHIGHKGGVMAIVRAKIITFFLNSFFKTPESGAQTTIFCAVDESVENESGLYYSDCKETRPSDRAMNEDDARRLWELSEQLTGLADKNNSKIKEID